MMYRFKISAKTGIQAPSLRRQRTIKNWVPVFTGNPGFLVKPGMTKRGECLYNYVENNIVTL